MRTRLRSIQVAALLVSFLVLPALLAGPDSLNPVTYAAVATVLMALAAVLTNEHAKVQAPALHARRDVTGRA